MGRGRRQRQPARIRFFLLHRRIRHRHHERIPGTPERTARRRGAAEAPGRMTAAAEATAPACRWPSLQHAAAHCLALRDPGEKVATTRAAAAQFFSGGLPLADESNWPAIPDPAVVGRPDRPLLVPPRQLAARGLGSDEGRAAFLHAIAHIEFNAINLAWDAVLRFPDMPADYYADWVSCADDEARHHLMLVGRLADFGHAYGDFDAH